MGITSETKSFVGDKIKIEKILNKEIIVHDFKIETSRFQEKGNGRSLHLQLEFKEEKHVLFSGSGYLMDMINKVPAASFPFTTTIQKINDHYEFT